MKNLNLNFYKALPGVYKVRDIVISLYIILRAFTVIIFDYISSIYKLHLPRYRIVSGGLNCYRCKPYHDHIESLFVIVFQGPVFDEFTIETIQLYRKSYPELKIIVSTWKGLSSSATLRLRELKVDVILSDDVEHSYDNQNRMIHSSLAGLRLAKLYAKDCFVIKQRCDQRLTQHGWLSYIESLILTFPSNNWGASRYRIGSLSSCSGKLRPFMLGDQFQFGHIDDMIMLWDVPFIENGIQELFNYFGFSGYLKNGFGIKADNYLLGHYIKKNNKKLDFSLTDSIQFWSEKGIVADAHSVGFFWARKELSKKLEVVYDNNPFNGSLSNNSGSSPMTFSNWLQIYRTGKYPIEEFSPEKWVVNGFRCGIPFYQITSLGGNELE
jgi:hypothetical protein